MLKFFAVLPAAIATVAAALAAAPMSEGEITKIDRPAGRVTLKHNGVANLKMPPMTMAFHVADAKLLDGLAVGDRVRFAADKLDGRYTVTVLAHP